jgi:hypothetical protein
MSGKATCALCGAGDLFGTGVCASCADDGQDRTLLFLQPSRDLRRRVETAARVRDWAGSVRYDMSLEDVLKGRRPMAQLPRPLALHAARVLAEHGIAARALGVDQWYRALPLTFIMMVMAVVAMGSLAGARAAPLLLLASPLAATLLVWAAALHMRRPMRMEVASRSTLPAHTRARLASALADVAPGRVRELLLEIARVGEATYASLPEPYRASSLGAAVVDLVNETGALALETERLGTIAGQLALALDENRAQSAAQLNVARGVRLALLEQTAAVLARIAREGARSENTAASEAGQLLQRVRAESTRIIEAQATVGELLTARSN